MVIYFDIYPNISSATRPDPQAHFCAGLQAFFVRWELNFYDDDEVLDCLRCECGHWLLDYDSKNGNQGALLISNVW